MIEWILSDPEATRRAKESMRIDQRPRQAAPVGFVNRKGDAL